MPPSIPLHLVNAFITDGLFTGNPAAVCQLGRWLDDAVLQAMAAQHNLSETAFLVPAGEGWELRWFTPAVEVDLCGHATLAAAAALQAAGNARERYTFATRSGELRVEASADGVFWMDFPAMPAETVEIAPGLEAIFGPVMAAGRNALDYLLVEVASAEAVKAFDSCARAAALEALEAFGLIFTAPGSGRPGEADFVSRFFAPRAGVLEDPVTGSAHCALFPWWAEKLGRRSLQARQLSARGGAMAGEISGPDRVRLGGRAQLYATGCIALP